MSSTLTYQKRVALARQSHQARQVRRWTIAAGLVALTIPVLAISAYFVCFSETLRAIVPESTEARVGCTWMDHLLGGEVEARVNTKGSSLEKIWTLDDGEMVRVVDDPGPTWNPGRLVTVTVKGSATPAQVRRWNLDATQLPQTSVRARLEKTFRRDENPLAANPERESQRETEVFLQLR